MKFISARVMLSLLLLASARLCLGQTIYEVEGTVYGPDGNVLPNAVINLQNHAGVQIDQDITKSDGRYRFAGVLAGTYYLAVKPADRTVQSVVQKIELINTGVSASNFSKERFDFTLKNATTPQSITGTVFAQVVPPEAEKSYQTALGYISKGDKGSAIKELKNAIGIFPTYFLALQQLGLLYIDVEKTNRQSNR